MPGTIFWIRRFAMIYAGALTVISVAQLLKGHSAAYSFTQGAIWGLISTTLVIALRLYKSRRGEACAVCNDTPVTPTPDDDRH